MQQIKPINLYPNIASVAEGSPDLAGCHLQTVDRGVDTTPVTTTTLIFTKEAPGDTHLTCIYVYLLNSGYGLADFTCGECLPDVVSYKVQDAEDSRTDKPMRALVLEFEKGSLSFTCERVFYVTSSYRIG
jgi:hypothetical protein